MIVITESRLRTRIHALAYGLCLLGFMLLGYLNLRYGFYSLFYGALALAALAAAGIGYTLWARQWQLRAAGHGLILGGMALVALLLNMDRPELALFWVFPLILLDLLILPLRRGLWLALCTVFLTGLWLLLAGRGLLAMAGLSAAFLLGAMAALFADRYHHHARSLGELVTTDAITGAFNSRHFTETLRREISRSEVNGHPLSLVHLAIDYYDELEDLHGAANLHPLLKATSDGIKKTIRAGDSHFYFGQGAFLLLLPFTPEEGVRVIAERVRRVLAEGHWPVVDSITASLGCVSRQPGETDPEVLPARAREALHEAQRRGHNRVWHLDQQQLRAGAPGNMGQETAS